MTWMIYWEFRIKQIYRKLKKLNLCVSIHKKILYKYIKIR